MNVQSQAVVYDVANANSNVGVDDTRKKEFFNEVNEHTKMSLEYGVDCMVHYTDKRSSIEYVVRGYCYNFARDNFKSSDTVLENFNTHCLQWIRGGGVTKQDKM